MKVSQLFPLIMIVSIIPGYLCCQAQTHLPGLLQDSLSLHINSAYHKQIYSYPTNFFQHKNPKIALTLSKIYMQNLAIIDFQIASIYTNLGTIGFYFFSKSNTSRWREVKLQFWLVGQQVTNIAVGHIVFENLKSSQTKSLLYNDRMQPLLQKVNQGLLSDPKVFISSILGLSAQSLSNNSMQIKTQGLVSKQIAFKQPLPRYSILFNAKSGQNTFIKFIRICYVVYAPSRLSADKYHYSSLSLTVLPSQNYYLIKQPLTIFPLIYSMIGVTGFRLSSLETFSLSFSIQESYIDLLKLNSISKIDNLQLNYLIIGIDMMMSCINCSDSFVQNNIDGVFCVNRKQCANDEIQVQDSNAIYYSCRKCSGNTVLMVHKNGTKYCGCKDTYAKQKDQTCKKIEVFKSKKDCEDPNSQRDLFTNKCVCKQGFYIDDFGFCGGCNPDNSYWDLNNQNCTCLPGFQYSEKNQLCVKIGQSCGTFQVLVNDSCICEQFKVKKQKFKGSSQFQCKQCESKTYKVQGKQQCKSCPITCRQCLTNTLCFTCNQGYFFKNFNCGNRCGDGFKTQNQDCDDGNYDNLDGCSENCTVQDQFICKEDSNKKSFCPKKISSNQIVNLKKQQSLQNNTKQQKNTPQDFTIASIAKKNIKNQNKPPTQYVNKIVPSRPQSIKINQENIALTKNVTIDQNNYKLSISKASPIYISSGIILELLVLPIRIRTQQELNTMFKIQISDKKSYPAAIYYSQDKKKLSNIRCYLHYNNQLPVVDFKIKIQAMIQTGIWKSLTLYYKSVGSLAKSVKPVMDDSDYLI